MEELQYAVDKNVYAQLEEYDDDGEGQIILHILDFDAIERRKTHLTRNIWDAEVTAMYQWPEQHIGWRSLQNQHVCGTPCLSIGSQVVAGGDMFALVASAGNATIAHTYLLNRQQLIFVSPVEKNNTLHAP